MVNELVWAMLPYDIKIISQATLAIMKLQIFFIGQCIYSVSCLTATVLLTGFGASLASHKPIHVLPYTNTITFGKNEFISSDIKRDTKLITKKH